MERDINQFVKTCHVCQERQLQLIKIPPMKTRTPSIFEVLHADIMHMTPASNGCKYIAHGRDGLISWPEGRPLRDEKAKSIALWIYEDILCRWGILSVIVTDNGGSFKAAVQWIAEKYGIKHITISPYNSQANGAIERPHWDIRQMLFKATGKTNVSKWYWFFNAVLWADRVTVRKSTGYSPYYLVTGNHPILPLDAAEATWLTIAPTNLVSEEDLISQRARALTKHRVHLDRMKDRIDKEKLKRLQVYEKDYKAVIKDYVFQPGDLVIVRNTAIESSLDKKMKPRYTGPMIVIVRNPGGSYILAEITGAIWRQKVARFRVLPYFARERIDISDTLKAIIADNEKTIKDIQEQTNDYSFSGRDYLMDDVVLQAEIDSETEVNEPDSQGI